MLDSMPELVKGAKAFCELVEVKTGYPVRLEYGSLLGCVREGGPIDWDYDIDLSITYESHDKQGVIKEVTDMIWFLKQNNLLVKYFFTGGEKHADSVVSKESILQPDGQMHTLAPIKSLAGGDLVLDLFTGWVDENGDFNSCKYGNMCKGADILPYKREKFGDYEFWIPNNPDPYLTKQYGDWRTPTQEKSIVGRDRFLYR
jgi:phosphorylcholine metabolism protein LicD